MLFKEPTIVTSLLGATFARGRNSWPVIPL
jgi:hypothetical protein